MSLFRNNGIPVNTVYLVSTLSSHRKAVLIQYFSIQTPKSD